MLEREQVRTTVKHTLHGSDTEALGQLIAVDAVALGCVLIPPAHVADEHASSVRMQQIVEPLRLRPFLEDNMDRLLVLRTNPRIACASVRTVDRITMPPAASRSVATVVAL
jgi:hypothetical protein